MTATEQQRLALADAVYERYGKPLEAEHWGKFAAITETGEVVLGSTFLEAVQLAEAAFGRGGFIFKIGEIAVGRWR